MQKIEVYAKESKVVDSARSYVFKVTRVVNFCLRALYTYLFTDTYAPGTCFSTHAETFSTAVQSVVKLFLLRALTTTMPKYLQFNRHVYEVLLCRDIFVCGC